MNEEETGAVIIIGFDNLEQAKAFKTWYDSGGGDDAAAGYYEDSGDKGKAFDLDMLILKEHS